MKNCLEQTGMKQVQVTQSCMYLGNMYMGEKNGCDYCLFLIVSMAFFLMLWSTSELKSEAAIEMEKEPTTFSPVQQMVTMETEQKL